MDKMIKKKYWKVEIKKTVEYTAETYVKCFQEPTTSEALDEKHELIEVCDWCEEDTDIEILNVEECEEDDCDDVIDLQPDEEDEKIISEYDKDQFLFDLISNTKVKKKDCYKNLVELKS